VCLACLVRAMSAAVFDCMCMFASEESHAKEAVGMRRFLRYWKRLAWPTAAPVSVSTSMQARVYALCAS
jgi:hypothetical protein